MPKKPTFLLKRGNKYYLRRRIPTDLLAAYNKSDKDPFIVRALKTEVYKDACKLLHIELVKLDSDFDVKRKELKQKHPKPKIELADLSESQREAIVLRWLEADDKDNKQVAATVEDNEKEEIVSNLLDEQILYNQDYRHGDHTEGQKTARRILEKENIGYSRSHDEYFSLAQMFSRAHIESLARLMQRINLDPVRGTEDPFWSKTLDDKDNHQNQISFGEVCAEYKNNISENLTPRSIAGLSSELEILMQLIPAATPIYSIDRAICREAARAIKKIPVHASKKFPDKNIRQAIAIGENGGVKLLSPNRANTYIERLKAVMQYAIDEMYISTQPAGNLNAYDGDPDKDKRDPFAAEQLNKIFHAPLYTGCKDDENGYMKIGENVPRRARFWLPLIALWSGLRLEEICQLYAVDVYDYRDIPIMDIQESKIHADKSLKTRNSIRVVPVHPELVKLGFLEYVKEIKRQEHKFLFPELVRSKNGTLGHSISKWFSRFLKNIDAKTDKTSFHSFRHTLAGGLKECETPEHIANALCGWEKNSMYSLYGKKEAIKKVYRHLKKAKYPDLDLKHLYIRK